MDKINFQNLPSTDTPLSAENMNLLQTNIENGIKDAGVVVSPTEPSTDRKKVWLKHGENLSPKTQLSTDINTNLIINVNGNTDYEISFKKSRISGVTITNDYVYWFYVIIFYDNNDTEISRIGTNDTTINGVRALRGTNIIKFDKIITTPSNCKKMVVNLSNANGDSNLNTLVSDIVIKVNVEDKEYILNDNNVYEEFKKDEKYVLFQGTGDGASIILNDEIENYKEMEIQYNVANMYGSNKFPIGSNMSYPLTIFWGANSNMITLSTKRVQISGTTLSVQNGRNVEMELKSTGITFTENNDNNSRLVITKIIGYK